ncbi:MAG: hypothetical protein AAFW69_10050, partial [Pseudomonadota bacterium]
LSALFLWGLSRSLGLGSADVTALTLFALAPPIASAAGLAFLMRADAGFALEVTLTATVLSPLIGPAMIALLLPELPGPSVVALALRLGGMIAGGLALALLLRRLFGAERIAANGKIVDGLAALGMFLFVLPLFDGVGAMVAALRVLALACLVNLGGHLATRRLSGAALTPAEAGALGIAAGNRTVALYLAALPAEPAFTLFVALYQFPMYLTPLLLPPVQERSTA